jgi:Transglycosylase SLT domain
MYPAASTQSFPVARRRARWRRPAGLTLVRYGLVGLALFLATNWVYQAVRKPVELLAPVSPFFAKTPRATWAAYGDLFRRHATTTISPEFLAALAQVESNGNPLARTYWRWQWSLSPFEIFRPASSAVGMFQITDARFQEAGRYCIQDNTATDSCWFTSLYNRILPGHAIEMTSAHLDLSVRQLLRRHGRRRVTPAQKEALAAVVHLCGLQRADAFGRRGFQALPDERCGDHRLGAYVARIQRLTREFAQLSEGRG